MQEYGERPSRMPIEGKEEKERSRMGRPLIFKIYNIDMFGSRESKPVRRHRTCFSGISPSTRTVVRRLLVDLISCQ